LSLAGASFLGVAAGVQSPGAEGKKRYSSPMTLDVSSSPVDRPGLPVACNPAYTSSGRPAPGTDLRNLRCLIPGVPPTEPRPAAVNMLEQRAQRAQQRDAWHHLYYPVITVSVNPLLVCFVHAEESMCLANKL